MKIIIILNNSIAFILEITISQHLYVRSQQLINWLVCLSPVTFRFSYLRVYSSQHSQQRTHTITQAVISFNIKCKPNAVHTGILSHT